WSSDVCSSDLGLSCFALELVELGPLRFDELSVLDRERGAHDFAQFLGENDRNCASIASVNRNGKGTGVAIVSINRAFSFPDTIGMTGWMIVVANEENSRPEIFV